MRNLYRKIIGQVLGGDQRIMATHYSQVYGLRISEPDDAARVVMETLDIVMTRLQNVHHDPYYSYMIEDQENMLLVRNYDYTIHEIPYPQYAEYPVILQVSL